MKNSLYTCHLRTMNPAETSIVVLSDSDSESEDPEVCTIDESVNSEVEVITLNDSIVNQPIVTFEIDTTPDYIPINVSYNKPKRGPKRRLDAPHDVIVSKQRKRLIEKNTTLAENIETCKQNECANTKSKVTSKSNEKGIAEIQPKFGDTSENDSRKPKIPQIQLSHTNIHEMMAAPHLAGGLRPIIIDGCNVAFAFGNGKFQFEGIIFVVEYFKKRGHEEIVSFLPQCYRNKFRAEDVDKQIKEYEKEKIISYTPSRYLNGKLIKPYDDRFIVQYASEREGVIISNDGYLDLIDEESSWRTTIEQRIINFTFARGLLMLPKDPLGPNGPTLDEMLKFPLT